MSGDYGSLDPETIRAAEVADLLDELPPLPHDHIREGRYATLRERAAAAKRQAEADLQRRREELERLTRDVRGHLSTIRPLSHRNADLLRIAKMHEEVEAGGNESICLECGAWPCDTVLLICRMTGMQVPKGQLREDA